MDDTNSSKYKVAVASTDGETVNQHYGRAEVFYIYDVDDNEGYDLTEKRTVSPVCMGGSHLKNEMEESVRRFLDCKYIAASRIGDGALSVMGGNGITGMELPGSIDDAILKIWKYNRTQRLFG